MTGNIVARRYATALYAVGQKKGAADLEAFGNELSALAGAIEETPEALRFFRNPVFSTEEKKAILKQLCDKVAVQKIVGNFCELLADKGRLALLPEISADFVAMLDKANGVVAGELVTAYELSDSRKVDLKDKLEKQTGQKLELEFSTDKSILGGIVLKIGDKILDASLRAQLQILKETIKRGE